MHFSPNPRQQLWSQLLSPSICLTVTTVSFVFTFSPKRFDAQIAAEVQTTDTDVYNKEIFSRYVVPKVSIAKQTQRVTGISFNGVEMTVRGQTVPVVNVKDALTWLESVPNVVIVAHNGRNYDLRILSYAITACCFQDIFLRNITGFVDSLPLIKSKFPKLEKYTQECLIEKF